MDFYKRASIICQSIPYGTVATYGQIALLCQKPKNSRQIGYALRTGKRTAAHFQPVSGGNRLRHLLVRRNGSGNDIQDVQPHLLHKRTCRRKMSVVRRRKGAAVDADAGHFGSSIAGFFFARR